MGSNASSAIKMGAIIVMTLIVISIGFLLVNSGKQTAENAHNELNQMNAILDESKFTDYENKTITGNQVQSLISKYSAEPVFVRVKTKTHTTWYNYSNEDLTSKIESDVNKRLIANMSIKGESNYINPNGKFSCTIVRDANETIMGIVFEQQ